MRRIHIQAGPEGTKTEIEEAWIETKRDKGVTDVIIEITEIIEIVVTTVTAETEMAETQGTEETTGIETGLTVIEIGVTGRGETATGTGVTEEIEVKEVIQEEKRNKKICIIIIGRIPPTP